MTGMDETQRHDNSNTHVGTETHYTHGNANRYTQRRRTCMQMYHVHLQDTFKVPKTNPTSYTHTRTQTNINPPTEIQTDTHQETYGHISSIMLYHSTHILYSNPTNSKNRYLHMYTHLYACTRLLTSAHQRHGAQWLPRRSALGQLAQHMRINDEVMLGIDTAHLHQQSILGRHEGRALCRGPSALALFLAAGSSPQQKRPVRERPPPSMRGAHSRPQLSSASGAPHLPRHRPGKCCDRLSCCGPC